MSFLDGLEDFVGGNDLVFGGMADGDKRKRAAKKQEAAYAQAAAMYNGLSNPDTRVGYSAGADVYSDPQYEAAQQHSLGQQQQLAMSPQMTAAERNILGQSDFAASQKEHANRMALQQQLGSQKLMSSGQGLSAMLGAGQSEANARRMAGAQALASSQQRQLTAMDQAANLATGLRSQGFSEASQRAKATDQMNVYNSQQKADEYTRELARLNSLYGVKTGGANLGYNNTSQGISDNAANNQQKSGIVGLLGSII